MKITGIEADVVRIPITGEVWPAWSPGNSWKEMQATIYRIHTDEGVTGIGAGRGAPDVVRNVVAPRLVGRDPADDRADRAHRHQ